MVIRRTKMADDARRKATAAAEKVRNEAKTMGPIDARCIYSVAEFIQLAGLSLAWLRNARKNGLVILSAGQKRYIRGVDWEDYLLKQNRAEHLRRIPNSMGYTPQLRGISPECVYPIVDVFKITGIRAQDIRQFKSGGMQIFSVGNRDYVQGQELIDALRKQGEADKVREEKYRERWERRF